MHTVKDVIKCSCVCMQIIEAILYPISSGFRFTSEENVQIRNHHKQYKHPIISIKSTIAVSP